MKKIILENGLLVIVALLFFTGSAIFTFSDEKYKYLSALIVMTGLTFPWCYGFMISIGKPFWKAVYIAAYFIGLVALTAKSLYWL